MRNYLWAQYYCQLSGYPPLSSLLGRRIRVPPNRICASASEFIFRCKMRALPRNRRRPHPPLSRPQGYSLARSLSRAGCASGRFNIAACSAACDREIMMFRVRTTGGQNVPPRLVSSGGCFYCSDNRPFRATWSALDGCIRSQCPNSSTVTKCYVTALHGPWPCWILPDE